MLPPCLLYRDTFGGFAVVHLKKPVFIGSSSHAGLRIANSTVSRFHCVIYPNGPLLENGTLRRGWYLRDLCSLNGTYLNGARLRHPARLSDGDCVRFGRTLAAMIILKTRHEH
jgi:pSer/pThr/pTyr-binding forkhead associated (FHA) protein